MSAPADPSARLAREIEHHRRIAARAEAIWDWDSPAGRRRAERRADLFVEHARLAPGRRTLELGCGTGVFLERAARSGAEIHALDLSPELLAQAHGRIAGAANVRLVRANVEQTPYRDGSFDAAYGSSILHHLDLEAALQEVFRVLRPGGLLVFAEPNILNPQIAFVFKLAPRGWLGLSPDEMAFSRFRARRLLERLGYQRVQVRPFDFLHPAVPRGLIEPMSRLGRTLEALPVVREIAGSLLILAAKPR